MFRKVLLGLTLSAATLFSLPVHAGIVAHPLVYKIGNQSFEGYVARNDGFGDRQPIVLLIHDWDGLDSYEKMRANLLSTQGYTVVALDLYGQGVRPKNVEESKAESGKLYGDRQLMRERLMAGLDVAKKLAGVDPEKVAVMGYCFGGSAVLELARAGVDLDGFISFHGGLALPTGEDYSQTKGQLLILQGSADPVSSMQDVAALAEDLNTAKVTYDMEIYGGAKHAYTNWNSPDYDPDADLKSWAELVKFLPTVFKEKV